MIHDVSFTSWRHGKATNRRSDILEFNFRFTPYWSGPLTTDDFTKVLSTFDLESQRMTAVQILATNGITLDELASALGALTGTMLVNALTR